MALLVPVAGWVGYQAGQSRSAPAPRWVEAQAPDREPFPAPRHDLPPVPPPAEPLLPSGAAPEPEGMVSGDGNAPFNLDSCPAAKQAALIRFGLRYEGEKMYLSVANLTGRTLTDLKPRLSRNQHKKEWSLARLGPGETVELGEPLVAPHDGAVYYRIGFGATRGGRAMKGTLGLPFVNACGSPDHPGWFIK